MTESVTSDKTWQEGVVIMIMDKIRKYMIVGLTVLSFAAVTACGAKKDTAAGNIEQRDHDRRSCAGHKNAEGHRRKISPADSKFIIKKSKPFWFALFLSEYLNYYFAEGGIFHHCKSG